MTMFTQGDFKKYREALGFTNQAGVKSFFGAKDVKPTIDLAYLDLLNERLKEMSSKIDSVIWDKVRVESIDDFNEEFVDSAFKLIKNSEILPRLNNLGRRPEEVYFSWMRGYLVANYLLKGLSYVFETNVENIRPIGDDSLMHVETFKKTPTADLEIRSPSGTVRIEAQSGFTGVNDIKQHKVLEAKKIFEGKGVPTIAVHADFFNGQVAFVRLDNIPEDSVNWITRQQLEGQTVFNIDQNSFFWLIQNEPPKFSQLELV